MPVFCGPVTLFEREGAVAKVEAQGKERLMLEPHFVGRGYSIRKHTRVDAAIRRVASEVGEERLALPSLPQKLNRARVVAPDSAPWLVIKGGEENAKGKTLPGLLDRAGKDLVPFYDARGRLAARPRSQSVGFTFQESAHLTSQPQIQFDLESFRNTVIVRGGKRKKRKSASARLSLPASHPLSPAALARNGKPRFLIEFLDVDGAKTDRACRKRAQKELGRLAHEGVTASFTCLPVPHIDETDLLAVETDEYRVTFPAGQMTLPLTPAEMSIGATRPVHR